MIEHESFYATVAQVVPVLMLAQAVELSVLSPSKTGQGRREREQDELTREEAVDPQVMTALRHEMARYERLSKRRRFVDPIFNAWMLLSTLGTVLLGLASLVLCILALDEVIADTAVTLSFVFYGFALHLGGFGMGLWARTKPLYVQMKNRRTDYATLASLTKRQLELRSEFAKKDLLLEQLNQQDSEVGKAIEEALSEAGLDDGGFFTPPKP